MKHDFFDLIGESRTTSAFDLFWAVWPDRRNKESARKAFGKLHPIERQKAMERAAEWCQQWRKDNPEASHIHAATYLNQKRFLDMEEVREVSKAVNLDAMRMQAQWIKDGKQFLTKTITREMLREMIAAGLVTEDECRKAGIA